MSVSQFILCLADLSNKFEYAIYGAGGGGKTLYQLLRTYRPDITINFFIDGFKAGKINSVDIIEPVKYFENKHDETILIATEYWYDVEKYLLINFSYDNYIKIPLRFLYTKTINQILEQKDAIEPVINDFFPLCFNGQENESIKNKFLQVENLLETEEEKQLYRILTCQNQTQLQCKEKIIKYYFSKKPSKQYLDFINPDKIKAIIDGGVYTGKETTYFLDAFDEDIIIYGFEPQIDILLNSPYYERLKGNNFIHINKGLWKNEEKLEFILDESSSRVIENKTNQKTISIDVTNIDKFVQDNHINKVDLIKLDIEGSELEALDGAKETLVNDRPQLAICIYHKQSDFYKIPLFLDNLLENYSFHIEHYTPGPFESVWYAIPNEIG